MSRIRVPFLLTLFLLGLIACGDNQPMNNCLADVDAGVCPEPPPPPPALVDVHLGPRPFFLIDDMDPGDLKTMLEDCEQGPFYRSDFSIGHRGAAMQFPEHTEQSYRAAARMGAGVIECDVTFTSDRHLVCRHAQCDLHRSTNILTIPALAAKCTQPFTPADPVNETPASALCCTSDITLAEFKTLCGKMDGANAQAATVDEYIAATDNWRTDLYATCGALMSHAESIELFQDLGVKMTPELKAPEVPMPYEGDYTQEQYAQQMIDEYVAAGVGPEQVYAQSFNLDDVRYWLANAPEFGAQAVYLDDRYEADIDPNDPATWTPTMAELAADGVQILAPPMWMLLTLDANNEIVPSLYAIEAKAAGMELITWTLERSGLLAGQGGFYYQSIASVINNDGDVYTALDVLAQDVGVLGVFSDWPATVTYYANCMGLP